VVNVHGNGKKVISKGSINARWTTVQRSSCENSNCPGVGNWLLMQNSFYQKKNITVFFLIFHANNVAQSFFTIHSYGDLFLCHFHHGHLPRINWVPLLFQVDLNETSAVLVISAALTLTLLLPLGELYQLMLGAKHIKNE